MHACRRASEQASKRANIHLIHARTPKPLKWSYMTNHRKPIMWNCLQSKIHGGEHSMGCPLLDARDNFFVTTLMLIMFIIIIIIIIIIIAISISINICVIVNRIAPLVDETCPRESKPTKFLDLSTWPYEQSSRAPSTQCLFHAVKNHAASLAPKWVT